MKKKDFNKRVCMMCDFIKNHKEDDMRNELIMRNIKTPFHYGAWCEKMFEANLREDYKRRTTFTSDFSIAEWCVPVGGMRAISDTLRNALTNWRDDVEFFAEIILVLNMKAWEHHARGNTNYASLYSELYIDAKSLYFDWFDEDNEQHDKAMEYYYDYVD